MTHDEKLFYPRVLVGTYGCIGAVLDCDDAHLVLRKVMPNIIINFTKEIGRFGTNRRSIEQGNIVNGDFVCMHQRIMGSVHGVCVIETHLVELCKMLSMISLEIGFWHVKLEQKCRNQGGGESMNYAIASCLNTCTNCDASWATFCWPIVKKVLIRFFSSCQ